MMILESLLLSASAAVDNHPQASRVFRKSDLNHSILPNSSGQMTFVKLNKQLPGTKSSHESHAAKVMAKRHNHMWQQVTWSNSKYRENIHAKFKRKKLKNRARVAQWIISIVKCSLAMIRPKIRLLKRYKVLIRYRMLKRNRVLSNLWSKWWQRNHKKLTKRVSRKSKSDNDLDQEAENSKRLSKLMRVRNKLNRRSLMRQRNAILSADVMHPKSIKQMRPQTEIRCLW
jgi:hypothetical protein